MKSAKYLVLTLTVALSMLTAEVNAQDKLPKEVVPTDGIITLSAKTPISVAFQALNDFSIRLDKKPLIANVSQSALTGIDIEKLPWKTALNLIVQFHGYEKVDTDTYIQVVESSGKVSTADGVGALDPDAITTDMKPVTSDTREIKISATFFDADRKKVQESGINWTALLNFKDLNILGQNNVVGEIAEGDIGAFSADYASGDVELSTVIKAMETEDLGDIIATPTISAINGRQGRVQVGQDFSIKQRDFAGNVIDVFVSTGVILTVTPQVYETDSTQFIHLLVSAERSSATPSSVSTIIAKTTAKTELLLNDGEEAIIGGLISTEESRSKKGIPVLNKIPKWFLGLGYLFGYESVQKTEKELIILLKAEIVPSLSERLALKQVGGDN